MPRTNLFKQDVRFVKGVGPERLKVLHKLGVRTVGDLLYYFPRDYEDRSQVKKVIDLKLGEVATLRVKVEEVQLNRSRRGRGIAYVAFRDETGQIVGVWFQTRYFDPKKFAVDREFYVSGKVDLYEKADRVQIVSPQCAPVEEGADQGPPGILPVYPLTEDLNQGLLRRIIGVAVRQYADEVEERLPESVRAAQKLMPITEAVRQIHLPESAALAAEARRRIVYEEFFFLELALALRRRGVRQEHGHAFTVTPTIDAHIRARFPFALTKAQDKAIAEISADMQRPEPMNRLLQGDVGSGKTVVALYALLVAIANRHQAAIMAPTEVLAEQHYHRFSRYLENSRVRTVLLRGSDTAAERREALAALKSGEANLIVGTHALIQENVDFDRLGVVVIDEQHKFGVMQRADLRLKGTRPDVLIMTATPIPRTLALTVFGDLDVSVIDELPPGRFRQESRLVTAGRVPAMWRFVRDRLGKGEQAFVVYPLVEESEKLDLRAATQQAEALQKGEFADFRVGLLHGRMSGAEKGEVMEAFRAGVIHVLVSTVVIEVGIDVPNATIMIVEHAERFGLATLHQLRGRIGRAGQKSWFFMLGDARSQDARERLRIVESTGDGFRLAEEDLRLRGPGEFLGTRQHGLPELHVADPIRDFAALRQARADAFNLIAQDGTLSSPEHVPLKAWLSERYGGRMHLIHVG